MERVEGDGKSAIELRFDGPALQAQGMPVYELGTTLVAVQRMLHKSHLIEDGRWVRGQVPGRRDRELLAVQLGGRQPGSDLYALVPLVSDPAAVAALARAIDLLLNALTSYAVGKALDAATAQPEHLAAEAGGKTETGSLIGAIYADVVNVVNRIGNVGGCETIQIGSPRFRQGEPVTFDRDTRDYVRSIPSARVLGPVQTIKGSVHRLYPDETIVEIRRPGGKRCKILLDATGFATVRYGQRKSAQIEATGRPRFRLGSQGRAF